METRKNSVNFKIAALILTILAVTSRLLPHPANVAPITALALFGGAYFPKKFFFIPLLALFISDLFIGFYGVEMFYVYGSFLLVNFLGRLLKANKGTANLIMVSFFSSIIFYLITNLGVWAEPNSWYSRDLNGLMQSYFMGLPFFRNTILGDLGFSIALFRGYEILQILAKKYLPHKLFQVVF